MTLVRDEEEPRVERHQQLQVRATVAPAPYAAAVREMLRAPVGPVPAV
ncbi:hypothetical protein GCU56_16595 [Geodermatophilus sabuli]|uniref:Uncharacterized protein n=1 Tax=Geodermatophilus sabuli TaxID=1564158 RepID=A0A7K3W3L3_9ACTN|nr:hypothetical protein [Geodermatophilus sabuli]NEK59479.1 hypothetical protein [Geodermatophilus sabuli]